MSLTILTPATDRRLTTLVTAKAELQITGTDDDSYIESLIDQASAAVETWCGRILAFEEVRETIEGGRVGNILASRFPVVEIVSASVAGDTINTALIEIEDGGFLYLLDSSGNRTPWQGGRKVITYKGGFILPGNIGSTLPKDIERATLLLIKHSYFARSRDPFIRSEEVVGIGTTSYGLGGVDRGATILPEVEGLLSRYRSVRLF